jgi:hypothetical protein
MAISNKERIESLDYILCNNILVMINVPFSPIAAEGLCLKKPFTELLSSGKEMYKPQTAVFSRILSTLKKNAHLLSNFGHVAVLQYDSQPAVLAYPSEGKRVTSVYKLSLPK